ncbi:carbon-nitrogen hydrolase [Arthrobacter pityocampae]|uniref:Carbon-nitrogen hydrolase n=1 Tax=Arthrobacter pityocampae TaxID=547334 RepID=A0A2S5ITX9_9MICC|nr:nitrilase-related carbon-nitrogen hydrolase [Arthrobacter pityocampae]PPB48013.1 carbon-nitrogen hydrolase [Arthrobacter pityocampae]
MPALAVLQAAGTVGAVEENLRRLDGFAARAAAQGAEILVTPELFATGYAPAVAAESDGAAIRDALACIARRYGIALVGSSVEATPDARHITASLFDHQGAELTRYRKSHLFGAEEQAVFAPGNERPEVLRLLGMSVALGICYDVEFPEFVRSAAGRGTDLLLIPTAVPATGDVGNRPPAHTYNAERISTLLVPARALENGVYIAYANHTAPGFTGLSCIVSPYGTFLGLAGDGEELLFAGVDPAEVRRAREINTYLLCRRPELFA